MTSPYGASTATSFSLSGDSTLDAFINWGAKWGNGGVGTSAVVTFSFPQSNLNWLDGYGNGEPFDGFQSFNAAQQQAARQALSLWSDVANITFQEVPDTANDVGDIRFGFSHVVTMDPSSIAWGYFPETYPEAGDIWFDHNYRPNLQMVPGQFGFYTLLHEIGHAIGLDHPFDDGAGEPVLPASMDNNQFTVMAYDVHPTASVEAMTPMLLDILAIQHIYGANMTTRIGDDVYKFSTTEQLRAIWDAGGIDTIDASNQTLGATIDLDDGTFSSIGRRNVGGSAQNNIAIAYGAIIENAIGGSGSDKIFGNEVANLLAGNAGNDILDGELGADTLRGGKGNDIYIVGDSDTIDEQSNKDLGDEVRITTSVNLTTFAAGLIERATALGNNAIDLTGNKAANILTGNAAINVINGGAGADMMKGGGGNDVYYVDSAGDRIDEGSNKDSADQVFSSVTVNLATLGKGQIEIATLTGSASVGITGNTQNNVITGNSKNNALNGAAGNDTLFGGDGNDTLTDTLGSNYSDGGNGNDRATGGAGHDTLVGGVGNDTLTGGAGHDTLTGGDGNDVLTGGTGNDTLAGGAGIDAMNGGAGSDTYFVDSDKDKVTDLGTTDLNDAVIASISIDLSKFAAGLIEHVTLVGDAVLNATGNARNNSIAGNDAANLLTGELGNDTLDGGLGVDTLRGGKGNDTYVVYDLADTIDEQGNTDSADRVRSAVTIDLAAVGQGAIEHADLIGTSAIDAAGNAFNNAVSGNEAGNTLDGREGNDTLTGNGGNDSLLGGIGNDLLDGGAGNDTLTGGDGNDTLRGGSGNDLYVLEDANDAISEGTNKDVGDEIQAAFTITLSYYDAGSIENATLLGTNAANAIGTSADNKLIGNVANNLLDGGTGNDFLDGGLGDDTLLGGAGNDTYVVDGVADIVDEKGNSDAGDEIRTGAFSIVLAAVNNGAIEHAMLLGSAGLDITGTDLSNRLIGNSAANVIDGKGGNDTLDGGSGDDTLHGGSGNDVYVLDSLGDIVDEGNGDSGDEIQTATFSIDLATLAGGALEHGTLLGSADLDLTGNTAANILVGNSGKNFLNGSAGNDTLRGGAGNDIYLVDWSDTIDEQANTDTGDEVRTEAMFVIDLSLLANGAIENATLLGSFNITAHGNAANNILVGNDGSNSLWGRDGDDQLVGGAGADDLDGDVGNDVMKGGSGNDRYFLDSLLDTVDEEGNTDTGDVVETSIDVDLSSLAGGAIEHAAVSGFGSASLKGSSIANALTGNSASNVLDGGGGNDVLKSGGGTDTLLGGDGDDTLVIISVTDLTIDGGSGTDTLQMFGPADIDLTAIPDTAIVGIERIDMWGGGSNILTATVQDIEAISGSGTLFIVGDSNDRVTFTEKASFTGYAVVDGLEYKTYEYGSTTVYIDSELDFPSAPIAPLLLAKLDDSSGTRIDLDSNDLDFGSRLSGVGDVNQDGFEDVLVVGVLTTYLLYGQGDAYDGPLSVKAPVGANIAELFHSDGMGYVPSVSRLGDFNGDGVLDFSVGDPGADFIANSHGGSYVVYGDSSGFIDQSSLWQLDSSAVARFSSGNTGLLFADHQRLASAGDLNGDGYDDLIMSPTGAFGPDSKASIAYVAFGRSDDPDVIRTASLNGNDGFAFKAPVVNLATFSTTVNGGSDFNGDGYADLVVGNEASAYVVYGHRSPFTASVHSSDLDGTIGTVVVGARFIAGQSGDFNGDGFEDVVLSSPGAVVDGQNGAGAVDVIFGKQSGLPVEFDVSQLNGSNGFQVVGTGHRNLGTSVTLAGDINADGFDDLLIGAPGVESSAFVIFGHAGTESATIGLDDIDGLNGFQIRGVNSSDKTGAAVSSADVNGDGFDDMIIGSPAATGNVFASGTTHVIYGEDFFGFSTVGTDAADTLNGSDHEDDIIGGQGNDLIHGGGNADAINAGQGNDEIHVADNKFFRIDGGTGVDTLHLDYDGAIDFGNLDGNISTSDRNRIENVEILDVDNGHANVLTLHLADVLDLDATISDVGGVASLDNVLRIDGNAGDTLQMFNVDGWGAADTSSLAGYAIYSYQAVKVAVDTDIVVSLT